MTEVYDTVAAFSRFEVGPKFSRAIVAVHMGDFFDTSLTELRDTPQDILKILLFNTSMTKYALNRDRYIPMFHAVVNYVGLDEYTMVYGNTNWAENRGSLELEPAVCATVKPVVEKLLRHLPPHAIVLSSTNEELVMQLAILRQHFSLPGLHPIQAEHFVSKAAFEECIAKKGLYTPRGTQVTFDLTADPDSEAERVLAMEALPPLPLMLKPIAGSGSRHTGKVQSRSDLVRFLQSRRHDGLRSYAAQELLDQWPMLTCYSVVTPSGEAVLGEVNLTVNHWADFVVKKTSVGYIYVEHGCELWTAMESVSRDVLDAVLGENRTPGAYFFECLIEPSALASPSLVVVQPGAKWLRFLECAARPMAGGHANWTIERRTGIDCEAKQILAQFAMDVERPSLDPAESSEHLGYIAYPSLEGILLKQIDIRQRIEALGGTVLRDRYLYSPGEELADAEAIDWIAIEASFTAPSRDELEKIVGEIKGDQVIWLEPLNQSAPGVMETAL